MIYIYVTTDPHCIESLNDNNNSEIIVLMKYAKGDL